MGIIGLFLGGAANGVSQLMLASGVVLAFERLIGVNPVVGPLLSAATGAVSLWIGNETMLMAYMSANKGALPTGARYAGAEGGYLGPGYGSLNVM